MIVEELRVHERSIRILRHVVEQPLHFSGWREGDEEPAGSTADAGPDVRNAARSKSGVAGVEGNALVAYLGDVLTFENVEPLVLMGMNVAGRTTSSEAVVLHGKERSLSVRSEDFEGQGAVGHVVQVAGAVLVVYDGLEERRGFLCSRGGRWGGRLAKSGGRDGASGEG